MSDAVLTLLEFTGLATWAIGLFMVGSRLFHGYWPPCGW